VGTGIGGGIVVGGRLHTGARGVAGEIGHSVIKPKGPRCHCGNRGCIEVLASRTAIERELKALIADGVRSRYKKMMRKGHPLTAHVIEDLLAGGDKAMVRVMKRAQRWLGLFTSNLINALDPEVIVFGGGIAERLGDSFVAPIREEAHQHVLSKRDLDRVRVVATALKEVAPVAGAAVLARERLGRGRGATRA
jgi:glucokinase